MKYFSQNLIAPAIFFVLFTVMFSPPIFVSAAPIVPDCMNPVKRGGVTRMVEECNFSDLMKLGRNIVNFLILLSIPLAAIAFAYSGFLLLTSGGDESKRGKAKEIFVKVLWGFIFVISAWLIVYTFTSLLKDDFLPSSIRLN